LAERTRLERLEQDRTAIEAAIEIAEPHQLPALVREHRLLLAEIESLAKPKEGSTRDQLAQRRASRQARA
jgi:hypothetical protein